MRAEQDRASPAQSRDHLVHLGLLQGVETARGLVDDQKRGIVQERLGERDALSKALREVPDQAPRNVCEVKSLQAAAHCEVEVSARQATQPTREA